MKKLLNISKISKNYLAAIALFFCSGFLSAQETITKEIDVDLSVGEETVWYGEPWLWIVGAAVFIIIIVALMRGGGNKN